LNVIVILNNIGVVITFGFIIYGTSRRLISIDEKGRHYTDNFKRSSVAMKN
jgi:hypothetical protein